MSVMMRILKTWSAPIRAPLRSMWVRAPGLRAWLLLLAGLIGHGIRGKTSHRAHMALVDLFVRTGGWSNDLLSRAVGVSFPPYRLPDAKGVLGDLDDQDLAAIQMDLEQHGYHVFENCL